MTPEESIALSRRAFAVEGVRWPAPLIAHLDDPPDDRRVFGWVSTCVGELLDHFDKGTLELEGSLSMVRRYDFGAIDLGQIEERAWSLWVRRTKEGEHFTAVAQLLFALSRGDRERRNLLAGACSTPICLLERLESRHGEVFDLVIASFSGYVGVEVP